MCFGWKHRTHKQMIGHKLFGNTDYHTNPDFQGAETYGLTESEFPPGGAGVNECWDALNAKYNLKEKFSLKEILEKARK